MPCRSSRPSVFAEQVACVPFAAVNFLAVPYAGYLAHAERAVAHAYVAECAGFADIDNRAQTQTERYGLPVHKVGRYVQVVALFYRVGSHGEFIGKIYYKFVELDVLAQVEVHCRLVVHSAVAVAHTYREKRARVVVK